MKLQLTALYRKVEDGYVAWVEELPGAISQGDTLDQARAMLKDAAMLILEVRRDLAAKETAGCEVIREPLLIERD